MMFPWSYYGISNIGCQFGAMNQAQIDSCSNDINMIHAIALLILTIFSQVICISQKWLTCKKKETILSLLVCWLLRWGSEWVFLRFVASFELNGHLLIEINCLPASCVPNLMPKIKLKISWNFSMWKKNCTFACNNLALQKRWQ